MRDQAVSQKQKQMKSSDRNVNSPHYATYYWKYFIKHIEWYCNFIKLQWKWITTKLKKYLIIKSFIDKNGRNSSILDMTYSITGKCIYLYVSQQCIIRDNRFTDYFVLTHMTKILSWSCFNFISSNIFFKLGVILV